MDSDLLLIAGFFAFFLGFRIALFFLSKRKADADLTVREEEIRNAVKGELDPMDISKLVDRANERWNRDRKDN